MLSYLEFILLMGLLASAGIIVMTNLKVERWCERWLERVSRQPPQKPPGRHEH